VGSIYRFYPSKHAIYIAISERYLEGFNNIVLEVVGVECGTKSWGDAVDEFVERCAIFYQQNAALARAWNVLLGNPETREAEARLGDQANSMWEKFLFESKLGFSRAECRKISVMIFWGITSLLELSARDDTGINRELVDETKFFVKAYLGAVLAAKESGGEPA
jgi:AcrR family transcriptional regulator